MKLLKIILKTLDSALTLLISVVMLTIGGDSLYAIWDNAQIYAAVDQVQSQLLKLKPDEDSKDNGESFEKLRKINPDVCAWLTLDNTKIDYPILKGSDNLTYINKDVYGNFAMAGSVFLDSGCDSSLCQHYSLLYGHHMENHKMFGDLDLYKNQTFFNENRTGTLYLPDRSLKLEILACFLLPADDENIFEPQRWNGQKKGLLDFAEKNAMYIHKDLAEKIADKEMQTQFLAMSTCSSEFTDARTVILAVISDEG